MMSSASENHVRKFSDIAGASFSTLLACQCNPRNESTANTTTIRPTI